jgi:hypothetical protein
MAKTTWEERIERRMASALALLAFIISLANFYFSTLYVRHRLQLSLTNSLYEYKRDDMEVVKQSLALVNTGNRQCLVLEIQSVVWGRTAWVNTKDELHGLSLPLVLNPGQLVAFDIEGTLLGKLSAYAEPRKGWPDQRVGVLGIRLKTISGDGVFHYTESPLRYELFGKDYTVAISGTETPVILNVFTRYTDKPDDHIPFPLDEHRASSPGR